MLKDKGIKTVIVVGTAANGAVLYTGSGAALRGYQGDRAGGRHVVARSTITLFRAVSTALASLGQRADGFARSW